MNDAQELKTFRQWLSYYRWPVGLTLALVVMVSVQGTMVYFALNSGVVLPEENYYEKAVAWDDELALRDVRRQLGWQLGFVLPQGPQYVRGMPWPVDLIVTDEKKQPVSGLTGDVLAVRPSDTRMNSQGALIELPHDPGHYRVMLTFPAFGQWQVNVKAKRGELEFLDTQRIVVRQGPES